MSGTDAECWHGERQPVTPEQARHAATVVRGRRDALKENDPERVEIEPALTPADGAGWRALALSRRRSRDRWKALAESYAPAEAFARVAIEDAEDAGLSPEQAQSNAET